MPNITEEAKSLFGYNFEPTTSTTAPVRSIVILGENTDVDTTTVPETLWDYASTQALYDFPTQATTATIVSSSAADDLGSTGAQIVLIEGLDADYNEIWEVVNMDGTTPVVTTNSYYRINFFRVVLSGTGKTNAGNITATVDSKVCGHIKAGESLDHTAVYTVPANHTLFLQKTSFSNIRDSGAGVRSTVQTRVYIPTTNTEYNSAEIAVETGPSTDTQNGFCFPRINEKSDLWYNITNTSANSTRIFGTIRFFLVHNAWIPKFIR